MKGMKKMKERVDYAYENAGIVCSALVIQIPVSWELADSAYVETYKMKTTEMCNSLQREHWSTISDKNTSSLPACMEEELFI